MRLLTTRFALAAAVLVSAAAKADADVITASPNLPPVTALDGNPIGYLTPTQVHAEYTGAGLDVILSQVIHSGFTNIQVSTSGPNEIETFNSTLTGMASINGSPNIPFTLTGPVSVTAFGKAGMTTGTFNTQMTSMDMTGTVAGHSVEVVIDPITPSTGQTSITAIGGGDFRINSFFDIFTDLSIDHGPFIPQNNGPSLVTATELPEPGALTLLGIGGLGLAASAWKRRRRAIA
jgi:hypothetical protein